MPRELKSLNALITGGATGLGAIIAGQLAAQGVGVCLNGLPNDQSAAQKHCEYLASTYNVKTTYILADVSTPNGCADAVSHTSKELGTTDIIIANAGWTKFAKWNDLEAFTEEEWLKSFKINTLVSLLKLGGSVRGECMGVTEKPPWSSLFHCPLHEHSCDLCAFAQSFFLTPELHARQPLVPKIFMAQTR